MWIYDSPIGKIEIKFDCNVKNMLYGWAMNVEGSILLPKQQPMMFILRLVALTLLIISKTQNQIFFHMTWETGTKYRINNQA